MLTCNCFDIAFALNKTNKQTNVLRQFTKRLSSLRNMTYEERLGAVNVTSLEKKRLCVHFIFAFKCMHG